MTATSSKGQIAVILPSPYGGGTFRLAKSIVKGLHQEAKRRNAPYSTAFYCPPGMLDKARGESDLLAEGIPVQSFHWQLVSVDQARQLCADRGIKASISTPKCSLPRDEDGTLGAAVLWFFISDRIPGSVLPLCRFVLLAADYLQRYVPSVLDTTGYYDAHSHYYDFLRNSRNADGLITTSPGTRQDAHDYVGKVRNLHQLPSPWDIDFLPSKSDEREHPLHGRPYFLWVTNPAKHKNHFRCGEAIERYYRDLDGRLDVVIVGAGSEVLAPAYNPPAGEYDHPYWHAVRKQLRGSFRGNEERVHFLGTASDPEFAALLAHARFLWHNVIADNGTYCAGEAAFCGTPTLSSDYPQMRYLAELIRVPMSFFDPFNPVAAATALKNMEDAGRIPSPSRAGISALTWQAVAPEYFDVCQEALRSEWPRKRIFL